MFILTVISSNRILARPYFHQGFTVIQHLGIALYLLFFANAPCPMTSNQ
nr:hypothetical protein [Nostoc sp. CreGUA01]